MARYGHEDDTLGFQLANARVWKHQSTESLQSDASTISEPEPSTSYRSWRRKLPESRILRLPLYATPPLLSFIPLVLLAALSPHFSEQLGANACLPSGEFVLPGTTSIWSPQNFFTITLAFTGPRANSYTYGAGDIAVLSGRGYTFTQAKVIDVAWDVIVGRGGQFILVAICYRVFRGVLSSLMETGEVGYDMFSTVAFGSGSLHSIGTMVLHAVGHTPIPRTGRAVAIYWMMAVATAYVVSWTTLLSAMTGYTSVYAPFLDFSAGSNGNVPDGSPRGLLDCLNTFEPAWGRMSKQFEPSYGVTDYWVIGYDPQGYHMMESGWIDYYHRYYDQIYRHCPEHLDISACPAAQVETFLHTVVPGHVSMYFYPSTNTTQNYTTLPQSHGIVTIPSPAPGIVPYANDTNNLGYTYGYYGCQSTGIAIANLTNIAGSNGQEATGICLTQSGYAWGFSFLLLFIVCVLNFVFVVILYVLWLGSDRYQSRQGSGSNEFKDAVTMVTAAQRQYGDHMNEWSATSLKKGIVKGYLGLGAVEDGGSDAVVKRRKKQKIVGGRTVIRD